MDPALECSYTISTFHYTFDNIAELQSKYPRGNYMNTDPIPDVSDLLNMDVCLKFYPCGRTNSKANYCALLLCVSQRNNQPIRPRYFTFELRLLLDQQLVAKWSFKNVLPPTESAGFGHHNLFNLLQNGKIVEQMTVQYTIKVFTERTYNIVKNMHPVFEIDPLQQYDNVMNFSDQSFDKIDEAIIKIKVGDQFEILKGSKRILTNASTPLAIRLEKAEWKGKDGRTYEIVGYSSVLVKDFIKSIHCGQLYGCDTLDGQLQMLKISDEYQVKWIKDEVCEIIEKSLTVENVLKCYFQADQSNGNDKLKDECFSICVDNFYDIAQTKEWYQFGENCSQLAYRISYKVAIRNKPGPSCRKRRHL